MSGKVKSVTIDDVMAWEPCNGYTRERVTELFAGRESVTALNILDMDILHGDRVDAVLRSTLIDKKTLRVLACDFAEHVLPLFEAECSDDDRPRKLVEAIRQWTAGLISSDEIEISIANASDAMRGIGSYPYVKSTAAANAIQAALRAITGMGIGGLGAANASVAALYATRACNIGGDGRERRWQVKHIRKLLGEETMTLDLEAIKQRFENAERDDLAPSDMADLIVEVERLWKEVETMRAFNSLLIGEAGIWIPCADCPDRQTSRYFSRETNRPVPQRPKPDTIRIKKENP